MATQTVRPLSRRELLKWAGIGGAGAVLAACAPREVIVTQQVEVTREVEVEKTVEVEKEVQVEVTAAPEARTLVVWWENWGDFYNDLMKKLGDSYTAEHPNITIDWTFSPNLTEELLTAFAAGTPPEVCLTRPGSCTSLAHEGALLPLDAYMVLTGLKREDFVTAMWDLSVWDGKLYAMPGGADFMALYWNKSLYADVGLDPEAPPKTCDELVEQSLQILEVDANGAIQRLGWTPGDWTNPYWMWAYIFGGELYDVQTRKVTASHPQNVEALKWIKSYVDQVDVNQLEAFNGSMPDFWSPGNSFASKKTALRFDGFWTYDALDEYAPDIDYGVCFFPTLNGTEEERTRYGVAGWMVSIPSGAPDPEASWDFVKYGFLDYAWKTGCETLNGNCVIDQMDEFEQCVLDMLGPENRMTPYFDVFVKTGIAATHHFPAMPAATFYDDQLGRAYDAVIRGGADPEAALQECEAAVQAELDRILGA
jgi:multiple sugar transport system substrate-binding protein